MRKNLLFLAMALFAMMGLANAQRPISNFSEDFEDGTLGIMTTIDADGDGHNWMNSSALQVQGDGHNGSARYAYSESWASALKTDRWGLNPDNFLVSPLVAIDETSVFTFYVCLDWYVYPGEHYGVAVSTASNTNPDDFTTIAEWDLNDKGTRDGDQGPWHEHNIDLSQYAGQNIYIAIRHFYCSNIYLIDLDDVSLTSQAGGSCEAPTNLTATASANTINLSWTPSPSAGTYRVFRGETMIANNLSGTTYTDRNLDYSTQYCYTVKTNCDNGNISGPSNQACATTADPCTAPTNVQAIVNGANVIITWNSVSSALSYTLYRDNTMIAENLTATNYIDENVENGHHCYTVVSECIEGSSPASAPACVDIELPCEAPTNFTGELVETQSSISLSWDAADGAVSYNVYRSETGSNYEMIANVAELQYTENVAEYHDYYYQVTAVYADGCESSPATTPEGESFLMFTVGDLGVEESMIKADIFPNPSDDAFNINCKGMTRLTVYGMRGETILDIDLDADSYTISELSAGVYFVRIETAAGCMTQKIVRL